jgi:type IV secretory pathway VirB10-like protein
MASEITASTVLAAVLTLGGLIPDYFDVGNTKQESSKLINVGNNVPVDYYKSAAPQIPQKNEITIEKPKIGSRVLNKPKPIQQRIIETKPKSFVVNSKPIQEAPGVEVKIEENKPKFIPQAPKIIPPKVTFSFAKEEAKDETEIKRKAILHTLRNASFKTNLRVTPREEYFAPEEFTPKKKIIQDPYLRQEDFGLNKSDASNRVNLERTITADNMISIILITAVNSHLKGKILAMIEDNVYASHGDNILIPKGSKCIGSYIPLKKLGDERLAISWTRIITPAGVNINLNAASADLMGRSGAIGELDNRYLDRYGLALSISTASNSLSYIALKSSNANNDGTLNAEETAKNDIIKSYKDDVTSITNEILKEQLKINPTINISSGTRMFIFPVDDIWFPQPENNNIDVQLVKSNKKGDE